jgi:GNAT superfamily N-acetyltransferase
MDELRIEPWEADEAVARTAELVALYARAYAESPYHKGRAEAEQFGVRLAEVARLPGFSFLAAVIDREPVGFAFGRHFGPGQWWYGAELLPTAEIMAAEKFAVSQLVVAPGHRGRGTASALMTALLRDRPEPYAALLSRPSSRARDIYRHWGWRPVGTARARPDRPANDALLLDLPARPALPAPGSMTS